MITEEELCTEDDNADEELCTEDDSAPDEDKTDELETVPGVLRSASQIPRPHVTARSFLSAAWVYRC